MTPETNGKSLVELLDMLKPAPEPVPISMAPQTWGWAGLAVLLLTAVATAAVLIWRHRKANAYRRLALSELDRYGKDTAKVAEILRRTALAAYPRSKVAGLYGREWVTFLQQTSDIKSFSSTATDALVAAPYQEQIIEPEAADLARHWIKSHKAEGTQ